MFFKLQESAIEERLLAHDHSAGACATFEGAVRELNEGRTVTALEYEAHGPLAEAEGNRVLQEAISRFELLDAAGVHRLGRLVVGDLAIRVEALARHRGAAFEACRWIVDQVKRRVPIWKKEFYADGGTDWVGATGPKEREEDFYRRQVRLEEVGEAGQEKLKQAHVAIIGAGGLGCPALSYLAAAGIGSMTVIDSDRVEASNLHRQPLFRYVDIGRAKAEVAAERLRAQNPFIEVSSFAVRLDSGNVLDLLADTNLILDATDNFETKFLLNDAAQKLGKTLICGSLHRFEGTMMVVEPGGPCLRCLWPETPAAGCVGTCAEIGVLGSVAGVVGSMQANEAIQRILGMPGLAAGEFLTIDLRSLSVRKMRIPRADGCPACGVEEVSLSNSLEIEPTADLSTYTVIDVREIIETQIQPIEGVTIMPMSTFDPGALPEGALAILCQHGRRSLEVTKYLRHLGRDEVYSIRGGVALMTGEDLA